MITGATKGKVDAIWQRDMFRSELAQNIHWMFWLVRNCARSTPSCQSAVVLCVERSDSFSG